MGRIIQKRFPMTYFVTMRKELFRRLTNPIDLQELRNILRLFVIGPHLTPIRWYRDLCSNEIVIDCMKRNCD